MKKKNPILETGIVHEQTYNISDEVQSTVTETKAFPRPGVSTPRPGVLVDKTGRDTFDPTKTSTREAKTLLRPELSTPRCSQDPISQVPDS